MPPLRIGTRASALALWQAHHVKGRLESLGHSVEIRMITTLGDRMLDRRLESVGGKGAFLKEIEEALLADEVDLAVHSLKDVPTELPPGLALCAFLERADPRDALVSSSGARLDGLPPGARLGTTSLRRQSQLRARRPDLVVADLRGNVDTRLRRLREGAFEAILLAVAGMRRLERASEITEVLEPEVLLPAPGQGAIALECRAGDERAAAAVLPLGHEPTARVVTAERAFLAALGGGCNVPLGALAEEADGQLRLRAFVGREDGSAWLRSESRGAEPGALGRAVAEDLLARGAASFLGR
ncbi:MAG TPA: hydroxymethylbilane synthase [Vicinamibacteria bacterium]|nr:hydroxymethylbilane synthase [Vicinamibacteria bacterium]